jgi:hypothetical protein
VLLSDGKEEIPTRKGQFADHLRSRRRLAFVSPSTVRLLQHVSLISKQQATASHRIVVLQQLDSPSRERLDTYGTAADTHLSYLSFSA